MDIIQALMLGIIQGIFEWLPISSEGQSMLIMFNILHMDIDSALSIAIFLHLGTSFAVLIKFKDEFISIISGHNNEYLRIILISTFCTGLTGLPLYFLLKNTFVSGSGATIIIGVLLICTGVILGTTKHSGHKSVDSITIFDMVLLGLAQGFAILPGISRSGVTITALLLRNVDQRSALTVSFIISVPVVLCAAVLDVGMIGSVDPICGGVMFLSSLVVGYIMMDFLLKFADKVDFSIFCIVLGLLTIILSAGYYIL
ncbi:MAG: undecaprenyl pyrophosphate phosphatase [ANME-2 cluster archaeon HR1]|nr:undecaprenyl-diphosphatase [ANME-2 cluster archaeon]PPA79762.1 MAG: undecaprenyl pyrophosphate phosphatase [ANME-2 cluster archaeon HR1]